MIDLAQSLQLLNIIYFSNNVEDKMSFSVNTNASSLSALQVLQATQRQAYVNQTTINTGLKVATAKDNAAIFTMAQNIRSEIAGMNALSIARQRDQSLLEITSVSINMIQDQILEMVELAIAASDPGITDQERQFLSESYLVHRDNIDRIASQANFQGINLIDSRESNFLTYGANPATIGPNNQTVSEPQPGQEVDLTFDFVGGGAQDEDIAGTVAYYYKWQDTSGVWHNDDGTDRFFIGATNVNGTTVTADGVPYTTNPITWTVPDISNAKAYEVYAEWGKPGDNLTIPFSFENAYWPAGDTIQPITDTFENGTQHVILSWGEYNSVDENSAISTNGGVDRYVDTINGYSVVPGNATADQTDGGDSFSADMQIVAPSDGITQFGASVNLYYEWQNDSGIWNRHAVPLDTVNTPLAAINTSNLIQLVDTNNGSSGPHSPDTLDDLTPFIELDNYSFSGTIPIVSGTIVQSRIVADVIATHDGDMIADTSPFRPNNLDFQLTSFTGPDNQVVNGKEVGSFLEGLGGGIVSMNVTIDNPDPSITDFDGRVTSYLEYFDGSNWQRVSSPLDSEFRSGGDVLTPLNFSLSGTLPSINDTVEQARIVVEFDMDHDGLGQPLDTKTLAIWDRNSTSAQPASSTTLISWNESVVNSPTTRREEFASKVETLNESNGNNRPLRLSNLGTSGLFGLNLASTNIDTFDNAKVALGRIQAALDQVISLGGYYGSELNRIERLITLDESMTNVLEVGIGNLVDANMAKESALLQTLQVKEQLGLQALNIANNAKNLILRLFGN